MTRIVSMLGCLLLASAAAAARDTSDDNEINLVVGGQKVISASGVQSYSEGVPGIVQIKVPDDGRRIVVTAVRPGTTTLLLILSGGKQETFLINVYSRAPQSIRNELKTLFAGLSGVDIREAGGRIFLDGAVPAQEDMARVDRIVALYGGQVASLVVVDPARSRTNIKLDLHFVQFKKNASYKFGFNYPANIGAHPGLGGSPPSTVNLNFTYDFILKAATQGQLVVTENLLPSLDILGARGWAKVNNVATVVTTNGGTATYHTGAEVNIKITGALGAGSLQKIPIGMQINVQPRFDPTSGMVVVSIDAEQSQLAPDLQSDRLSRVLTQTKTNVHVRLGQSIMLSGFKENTEFLQANGLPLFMRIPILGYLFRSEQNASENSENVLFITPTVIEHTSPENARRIEDALKRYEDFGGHIVY